MSLYAFPHIPRQVEDNHSLKGFIYLKLTQEAWFANGSLLFSQ